MEPSAFQASSQVASIAPLRGVTPFTDENTSPLPQINLQLLKGGLGTSSSVLKPEGQQPFLPSVSTSPGALSCLPRGRCRSGGKHPRESRAGGDPRAHLHRVVVYHETARASILPHASPVKCSAEFQFPSGACWSCSEQSRNKLNREVS